MAHGRLVPLLLPGLLAASTVYAQPPAEKPAAWFGGGGLLVGIPLGDFGDAADEGFGVVGHAVFTPGRGAFGIRLQVGGLVYGSREIGVPVAGTGGLVWEDLSTDNWLFNAGIGPQVVARSGKVRPYAYALAGLGYFATETSLGDEWYDSSTTNYDDTTFAWAAGAGILLSVSRGLSIDVGVQYVGNGTVSYLVEGDLVPSPDGTPPLVVPRRTDANLVTITVGVVFGR